MHIVVISGMLGAGKTSVILGLIKDLMDKGKKIAVIENDYGALGIDGDIIKDNGMEVFELGGGCVCCTLKTGLIDTLKYLEANVTPEIVLVEPSGIADPSYVMSAVEDISGLNVKKISAVIVVDAERFMKMRTMFERPLKNQFDVADLVLINKTDTRTDEELNEIEGSVKAMGYNGPMVRIQAEGRKNTERIPEMIGI